MTPSPRVGLFVTCVVDQVAPDVGIATVRLLEAAGALVEFPAAQTCCGQPAISAGEPEAAARLAQHFVDVFDECDAIVAPSGSCVAMVHHWFSRLLPHDDRVASLVHRTFELTTYLVDELGQTDFYAGGLGAPLDTTVTVHDACHGLRNLGIHDAPRALLEAAGATLIEMDEADTCCGFGGTFATKHGEIAGPLADDKLDRAAATQARWLVSGDTACLLHLEGRRRRIGRGPEPIHIASLLARGLSA